MKALRILMILALTLAVLPWGVYAAHGPGHRIGAAIQVSQLADVATQAETAQMRAARLCKGGMMAGCSADLAVLPVDASPPAGGSGQAWRPASGRVLQGITPLGSTDPPRRG